MSPSGLLTLFVLLKVWRSVSQKEHEPGEEPGEKEGGEVLTAMHVTKDGVNI